MKLTPDEQLAIALRVLPPAPVPRAEVDVRAPHEHSRSKYQNGHSACDGCREASREYHRKRHAALREERGWA